MAWLREGEGEVGRINGKISQRDSWETTGRGGTEKETGR